MSNLQILLKVQATVSDIESRYPPEVAKTMGRDYIAGLPDNEWQVVEDAIQLFTSPVGARLLGWDTSEVQKLFERAKAFREQAQAHTHGYQQ
jgi:hypothetical protein